MFKKFFAALFKATPVATYFKMLKIAIVVLVGLILLGGAAWFYHYVTELQKKNVELQVTVGTQKDRISELELTQKQTVQTGEVNVAAVSENKDNHAKADEVKHDVTNKRDVAVAKIKAKYQRAPAPTPQEVRGFTAEDNEIADVQISALWENYCKSVGVDISDCKKNQKKIDVSGDNGLGYMNAKITPRLQEHFALADATFEGRLHYLEIEDITANTPLDKTGDVQDTSVSTKNEEDGLA